MTTSLLPIEFASPVNSLDAYIFQVNQIPVLTAQEEQEAARELFENNDLKAAKKLILAHLRYVVRVAKGYMGYGLPLSDLIQEGNIGLMKAVKRFDPTVGVRLVSFAVHWIKSEIHEYVLKNWRIVKIATTKAQRKLFFNLRKMKSRLGWFSQEEIQQVADDLGVSTKDVVAMEARLNAMDMAYDAPHDDSNDTPAYYPSQTLSGGDDPAELILESDQQQVQHEALSQALTHLDQRSRDILHARWLGDQKVTLKDLAHRFSVSPERIRQLEANALKQLKESLA